MHTLTVALSWASAHWYVLALVAVSLLDYVLGRSKSVVANSILHAVENILRAALGVGPAGNFGDAERAARQAAIDELAKRRAQGGYSRVRLLGALALAMPLWVALWLAALAGCTLSPYAQARTALAAVAVADTGAYLAVQAADKPAQEKLAHAPCDAPPSVCLARVEGAVAEYRHKRGEALDVLHAVESSLVLASKAVDEAEAHKLDVAGLVGPLLQEWTQAAKVLGDFGVKVPTVNAVAGLLGGGGQ